MKKLNLYLLAALTALCVANTNQVMAAATQNEALIKVTGYAERELVPDSAYVNLAMESQDTSLEIAKNKNEAVMTKFNASMSNLGVNKENIKTNAYSVLPRYDKNGEKITGYTVINSLKIKVSDLKLLPKLLKEAGNVGINNINDIEFFCSNTANLKAELIKAAVSNGRLVAQAAATAAGGELGKIKEIHVNGRFPNFSIARADSVRLMKANSAENAPVLEQGTQKVSETVDLVFFID